MTEYFIVANSCAAPFFSDTDYFHQKAEDPKEALHAFKRRYRHPCGLFSAAVFKNATEFHKGKRALINWLSVKAKIQSEP